MHPNPLATPTSLLTPGLTPVRLDRQLLAAALALKQPQSRSQLFGCSYFLLLCTLTLAMSSAPRQAEATEHAPSLKSATKRARNQPPAIRLCPSPPSPPPLPLLLALPLDARRQIESALESRSFMRLALSSQAFFTALTGAPEAVDYRRKHAQDTLSEVRQISYQLFLRQNNRSHRLKAPYCSNALRLSFTTMDELRDFLNSTDVAAFDRLALRLKNPQQPIPADLWRLLAQKLPHLVELDFSHNRIQDEGVRQLATLLLPELPHLTSLNLMGNSISSAGVRHLIDALPQTALFSLNCNFNPVGAQGRERLSRAFPGQRFEFLDLWPHPGPPLREGLHLHLLGVVQADRAAFHFTQWSELLKGLPELEILELEGGAGMSLEQIDLLAWQLRQMPQLTVLSLRNNLLGDTEILRLARHLKDAPRLRRLDFSYNRFGDAGIIALAAELKHFPQLREINLNDVPFGRDGIAALASQLKHVPRLRILRLSNRSGEAATQREGAIGLLAQQLKRVPFLVELNLGGHCASDSDIQALSTNLHHTRYLESLMLDHCRLSYLQLIQVAHHLQDLPELTELALSFNFFGDTGARYLSLYLPQAASLRDLYLCPGQHQSPLQDSTQEQLRQAATPGCRLHF